MTPDTPVDLAVAEERWATGQGITDTETSALFAEVTRLRVERDALIARLRDAAENNPKFLRDVAGISAGYGVTARVLRVVADVIE